jgi:hypothetical protein
VVLENLDSLDISTRQDVASDWTKEDIGKQLPSHIKLVIKADGKFWPELIMRVQL